MNSYTSYIVAQGDTLESVSLNQLGSDQVANIVALNDLRYPYISDNPFDQFSQSKGTLQISASLNSGMFSFSLGNTNAITVNPYDTIFLSDDITGAYEAVVVKSVEPSSNSVAITTQSALVNSYSIATTATAFVNQENIITKVLQTGDTLYLPTVPNALFSLSQSTTDIYGTDWYVSDDGFLQRNGTQIQLTSGLDNAQQAMTLALRTPYGAMEGEKAYGNKVFGIVGEASEPYFWNLAEAYSSQCVLADARISSIQDVSIVTDGDSSNIVVQAVPATSQNVITTQTPLPTGGG